MPGNWIMTLSCTIYTNSMLRRLSVYYYTHMHSMLKWLNRDINSILEIEIMTLFCAVLCLPNTNSMLGRLSIL